MTCPICSSALYEQNRLEITTGTFISIRCTNPSCGYFDYKAIPVNLSGTITEV
jgi:predicted nucleic-acid-binding Zn-ribbon protein